jgi:hypothetical protein
VPDEALQLLSFFNDYRKLASVEASDLGLPFQVKNLINFYKKSS